MPDDRTYIRVHDGLPDHPKVEPLSDAAFRLLVTLWCWSSRHLTDGRIKEAVWVKRGTNKTRAELLTAGLAERIDPDTVELHDYLEHQRSAAEVLALKEKRRAAGSLGGKAKAKAVASAKQVLKQTASKNVPSTETETDKNKNLGARPRRERPADPIWDALVGALRIDAGQLTTTARGALNRAVAELRAVNATPQQIGERAHAYRRTYPNAALTPAALVKHWSQLNGAKPESAPPYYEAWPS